MTQITDDLLAVEQNRNNSFKQFRTLCIKGLYWDERMVSGTHGEVWVVFVLQLSRR